MNKLLQKSFVALAASAFLVACSDDSSDSFGEGAEGVSCTVVKKDPLVIEAVEEGFYSKTTFEFDDGDVIETVEFENHKAVQLACSQYTKDSDYKSVECSDKSIVAVGKETFTASEYKRMMDAFASECEKMSDVKSSSSSAKSSSSRPASSSSTKRSSGSDYCEIQSGNPFVAEMVSQGFYSKTTLELKNGNIIETVEIDDDELVDLVCSSYESDPDYSSVTCDGNTIVAIDSEGNTSEQFDQIVGYIEDVCEEINQTPSSSSSANPSSSANSSSSVTSSSSSVRTGEAMSAMYVQYWNDKVVAANADDLSGCEESSLPDDMDQYEIAYEFNDPYDLGADYIGEKINAYQDLVVKAPSAECGSIVLDGSNGLIIPKNDIFKTKGFVIEVRFMPTEKGDLSNIFVADPPGGGVDGWQVRLDDFKARFHIRDGSWTGDWKVYEAGEVSLNEWHVFRVKLFPTKSDDGIISYTLSISLDGEVSEEVPFEGNVSDYEFDMGIGYDAVYQGAHARRTFKGKIDYIRYGRITEDGL